MKIVECISTGKVIYKQDPDFEDGKGIKSSRVLHPEIPETDMIEKTVDLTEQQYSDRFESERPWIEKMYISDKTMMPRFLEDLITENPDLNIHEKMKARYDEKVALRATQ
tara:strand:- start:34 stop:363 length:330 start_codon:yes stop_codon:yes gene_type:complete